MDCSMPGFPVHHQLTEFTQTHVHWVSDAIQPSHPLSSPSPPTFNLSKHQGLFKCSDFGAPKNKVSHCFPIYLPWSDGTGCHDLSFLNVEPTFSLSSFTFIKRLFSSSHFLTLEWYHLHIWGCWYFFWQSWFQLVIHSAQHFAWCTLLLLRHFSRVWLCATP